MKKNLKISALFLACVLLFTCSCMHTFAERVDGDINFTEKIEYSYISEIVEQPKLETDVFDNICFFSTAGETPTITDTNEILWFDRLANKPSYTYEFYTWLNNNSTETGALATAQEVTLSNGAQAHKVVTFNATKEFTFPYGASQQTIKSKASAAIKDETNSNFDIASNWINETYACFDRDFPEVFWLSGSSATVTTISNKISYSPSACTGEVEYTQNVYFVLQSSTTDVRADEYTDSSVIKSDIANVEYSVSEITCAVENKTDYEKIKYFNRFLTVNNGYNANINTASTHAWECVSALQGLGGSKAPVCEGYARAFMVLCNNAEIPCVLVSGDSGGPHMWNNVYLDGKWYAVDVTWNDPGLLKEDYPESGNENENYLLVGGNTVISNKTFDQSHLVNNTVFTNGVAYINGPELSSISFAESEHKCIQTDGACMVCKSVCFDSDRDGLINVLDYVKLKNAVLQQKTTGNFDCNADGVINGLDLTEFKKYIWSLF